MRDVRHHKSRNGSVLGDLLEFLSDVALGGVVQTLRETVLDLVHESLGLVLTYLCAGAAILLGAAFLVCAGILALRSLPLPESVVYALGGVPILGLGIGLLGWARSKRPG